MLFVFSAMLLIAGAISRGNTATPVGVSDGSGALQQPARDPS